MVSNTGICTVTAPMGEYLYSDARTSGHREILSLRLTSTPIGKPEGSWELTPSFQSDGTVGYDLSGFLTNQEEGGGLNLQCTLPYGTASQRVVFPISPSCWGVQEKKFRS